MKATSRNLRRIQVALCVAVLISSCNSNTMTEEDVSVTTTSGRSATTATTIKPTTTTIRPTTTTVRPTTTTLATPTFGFDIYVYDDNFDSIEGGGCFATGFAYFVTDGSTVFFRDSETSAVVGSALLQAGEMEWDPSDPDVSTATGPELNLFFRCKFPSVFVDTVVEANRVYDFVISDQPPVRYLGSDLIPGGYGWQYSDVSAEDERQRIRLGS